MQHQDATKQNLNRANLILILWGKSGIIKFEFKSILGFIVSDLMNILLSYLYTEIVFFSHELKSQQLQSVIGILFEIGTQLICTHIWVIFSFMSRHWSELNFTYKDLHEQAAFETKYCRAYLRIQYLFIRNWC